MAWRKNKGTSRDRSQCGFFFFTVFVAMCIQFQQDCKAGSAIYLAVLKLNAHTKHTMKKEKLHWLLTLLVPLKCKSQNRLLSCSNQLFSGAFQFFLNSVAQAYIRLAWQSESRANPSSIPCQSSGWSSASCMLLFGYSSCYIITFIISLFQFG